MKAFSPKWRWIGLIAAVAAAVILIGWTERHAWREADKLQARFQSMKRSGYHLADYLEAAVLRMNSVLVRFDLLERPADRARFHEESQTFKAWLEHHGTSAATAEERRLLEEAAAAFSIYVGIAAQILEESAQTAGPGSAANLLERIEKESDRLLAVGRKLAAAQRELLQRDLEAAHHAVTEMKLLLAVSFGVLILLSVSLALLVWRGMITPLRLKLMESRALLERQEKLASLGVLAAGVAHEIRNPLTAIKARLFTQRKLLPEESESLEDNQFISDEIIRLDGIVQDFLRFARPSQPQLQLLRASAPLLDSCELFRAQLEKQRIEVKCQFQADPWIKADPQQLKQVLINLIKNAAESIGRDGRITLRTRTRPAQRGSQRAVAVLEVEDTGEGISPPVQKRLFDPFFTTKESGTGLGLSVAARIVEKHGGSLEYQTESGRGTVFSVLLPIAQNNDIKERQNSAG